MTQEHSGICARFLSFVKDCSQSSISTGVLRPCSLYKLWKDGVAVLPGRKNGQAPPNQFELVCPKCGRLEILDTAVQYSRREAIGRKPRSVSHANLCKVLERYGILHAFNTAVLSGREVEILSRWVFEGDLIQEMQRQSERPVNYVCFLHDYFHAVPEEVSPQKRVIL